MKTKMFQRSFLFIVLLVLAVLWILQLTSAWPSDPTVNVPICTAAGAQYYPQLVSDGAGGAIITWEDLRSGGHIYAQHVDSSGAVLWTTDGVPICMAEGVQESPQLVSDGAGGAIISWVDSRNGSGTWDIYAQRVDTNGAVLWATDGIPICTAIYPQGLPQLVSDGADGAIITWCDGRSGYNDIYAQRLNSSGTVLWTMDGVPICTAESNQESPQLVSDGADGAIITWYDYRSGECDIYAQRVDESGAVLWTINGVPICMTTDNQINPQLVSDGVGGAIIVWNDFGSGKWDIYAQRVNASGVALWITDGVPICTAEGAQYHPQLVNDGADGAIITWQDERSDPHGDIYAQQVNASGAVLWTKDGIPICTAEGLQYYPQLVSDSAGGAIITWEGGYAQRVDASGAVLWTTDGVPICTAEGWPQYPQLVSDGASGAIITWQDNRSDYADIYAQRVFSDGSLPVTLSSFTATASDGKVTLTWRTETEVNNAGFDIYRSDAKDGKYVKVNARLVQGAGTDATPHDYSFTDENVAVGKTYYYYIEDVDFSGKTNRSHIIEVTVGKQSIKQEQIPLKFALLQNYPNPFNPETWLPYELAESVEVTLQIYDVSGKVVRSLRLGQKPAGVYVDKERAIYWDGRDEKGEQVSSGIYFYRLQAGSFTGVRKMVILK